MKRRLIDGKNMCFRPLSSLPWMVVGHSNKEALN